MKNESYLLDLVKYHIREQSDLNEGGRRGLWKPVWNKEDQMLAMYNAQYGLEDLGMGNQREIVETIIGSSIDSLVQQTSNFNYLLGKGGLSRDSHQQEPVFLEFKDLPKSKFKELCLEIIHKRLENPEESAVKFKLGNEIGSKRDEIDQARKEGFRKKGIDPDKRRLTMIGSHLKDPPVEDEPESEPSVTKQTEKDQIKDFINSVRDRLQNVNSKEDALTLANDLEFIIGYIDSELTDKNMVAEITNILKNKNVITESKVVREFKRITEMIKKI